MAGKLQNYLSSKDFRGGKDQEEILGELLTLRKAGKENWLQCGTLYGKGVAWEEVQRDPEHPDAAKYAGKPLSINIIGEFKFVSDFTGEVKEGLGAIVPRFFAKMIQGQLANSPDASFMVYIGAEYTGRSIPWAWAIKKVLEDTASPLAAMEASMRQAGVKGLPAPSGTAMLDHAKEVVADKAKVKAG